METLKDISNEDLLFKFVNQIRSYSEVKIGGKSIMDHNIEYLFGDLINEILKRMQNDADIHMAM